MKKLKHFEQPKDVLDYIASEFVATLEDDLARMNGSERQHYTNEDLHVMRGKLHDVKILADLLPGMWDRLDILANMKTEEEFEEGECPPSENWIATLSVMIAEARKAISWKKGK